MEFLQNRYRNLTVLLVVIGAQLLLLAYQVKGNQEVRWVRVWAVTAVTPLARILEVVRRNTIGVAEDYVNLPQEEQLPSLEHMKLNTTSLNKAAKGTTEVLLLCR